MAIRLVSNGKVHGVLSVTVPAEMAPGEEEKGLVKQLAGEVSFALRSLELAQAHAPSRTAEGERQQRGGETGGDFAPEAGKVRTN